MSWTTDAGPQLVGRAPELAAALAALAAPEGRGVLLSGPLGVGKTRLATEIAGRRAGGGAVVVRAIATSATSEIPFGALASVIPAGLRTGDRRDAVVERLVSSLAAEADGATILLVVDDVDHLDPGSHAVVRALVERRVATVVGTVRTPHPPLPAPWSAPGVVHLTLGDLDDDRVAELLVSSLGGPVAGGTTRHLSAVTRGNPLLLREALATARSDGTLRQVDGIWALEEGTSPVGHLGDLVAGRIARLDPAARDAVELVATAEVLPVELAETLVDPGVLARLEVLGLVRRDAALGQAVLRPAHPVYGEALRAGLGPIARRHHARRLADVAEVAPAAAGVDVLRVVGWRVAAGGEVGVELLARAAREARRRSEFDQAEDLAQRAAAAGGGASALLLLGEIQNARGRYEAAEETFARALSPLWDGEVSDLDAETASTLALCALAHAFNRAWGLGRGRSARELLQRVEAVLAAAPVAEAIADRRAELAADAAALAAFTGDPRQATIEAAALLGDDLPARVVARAAFASAAGHLGIGRPDVAVELSARGLRALDGLGEGFGRATFTANLMLTLVMGRLESGEVGAAEELAGALYRRSLDMALVTGQAVSAWALGRVLVVSGRPASAARWLGEARSIERDLRTRGRQRWSLIGTAMAAVDRGDPQAAAEVLAVLDATDAQDPVDDRFLAADEVCVRASVRRAAGELSAADALLVEAASAATAIGDVGSALVLHHELVLHGTGARSVAAAIEALGATSEVTGRLHLARVEDARRAAAGDAEGRLDLAAGLASSGAGRLAGEIASSVAREAAGDGRRGLADRAHVLRSAVLAESGADEERSGLARLQVLGPRQREVVLLAARGRSNAEIAEGLGLAVRTVENHLHRAYAELGVDGRRGLVALLSGSP